MPLKPLGTVSMSNGFMPRSASEIIFRRFSSAQLRMPRCLSNQRNRFLLRGPSMVASAILANMASAVGNGSMRRPAQPSDRARNRSSRGLGRWHRHPRDWHRRRARSVVVFLVLEKVQRRGYLAHHDHDRLRRCLDGPGLGQVADDALDVGEELPLPFAQTLHVPARLRVSELDDDDLRLGGLFMLASLLAGTRCRICHRQSPSSSSSSSSTLIFGILKGAALRISFMAFFCAFIRFGGTSNIQDFPPFATESRWR